MEVKNPGKSDQITRDYLDSLLLEMRHLDSKKPDTTLRLYGEVFDTPIMMAALSHLNNIHEHGMAEMAKGAVLANAVNWAGMGEKEELEEIVGTGARTIKIIKPYADNDIIFDRMAHAEKCGVLAVGMDIDHAFNGTGGYDVVLDLPMKPKSTEEIRSFVIAAEMPFIIKGVLSAHDAEKCVEAGARGIVVSHHHGIMPYSVPPLMVLPEIVKAVNGQIPVFVDCGIVSGVDAFKALALGATAVGVGRELMGPLKDGGFAVAKRIQEMTGELKSIMARTGARSLRDIDPSVIHFRNF